MNLRKKPEIVHAKFEDDKLKTLYMQDTTPIQWDCYRERQFGDRGWTETRMFKKIASIPESELIEHPEWKHDKKALDRWLQNEGRPFKI